MFVDRRTALGLIAAGAALPWPAGAQTVAEGVSVVRYPSGRASIAAVLFEPVGAATQGPMAGASVVLLHGSGGAQDDAHLFTEGAVGLTRRGYRCLMPNYYDATPNQTRSSEAARRQWRRAIMDGIAWMGAQPGLDPARVGAIGFSRGAGLVLDGALREGGPSAVVAIGGGGAPEPGDIRHRPPVLLLWSTGDAARADGGMQRLEARLRAAGVPVEAETFDSPDHRFDPAAGRVAFARIEAFLERTLARPA